jgi:hypothetical protein
MSIGVKIMKNIKMSDVFDLPFKDNGYNSFVTDNHDQTKAAIHAINSHDALTARVAELESKTKWLCPDSNPPEKDFEVITCSDDDVGLSTYRENQDGSHYFDGMANVSGWMPKPEALEDKS